MQVIFEDKALEELYVYGTTNDKRFRKYTKDSFFIKCYRENIDNIMAVGSFNDLFNIPTLHYERLKYQYSGFSSFRIKNRKYIERVICQECKDYIRLKIIELDDTHYGNK